MSSYTRSHHGCSNWNSFADRRAEAAAGGGCMGRGMGVARHHFERPRPPSHFVYYLYHGKHAGNGLREVKRRANHSL